MTENVFGNDGEIPDNRILQVHNIDPLMAKGLDFTPEDLIANRNGRLTERQGELLTRIEAEAKHPDYPIFYWGGAVIVSIIGGGFFTALTADGDVLFAFCVVVMGIAVLVDGVVTSGKIYEDRVIAQTGVVTIWKEYASFIDEEYYRLHINGLTFRITADMFKPFRDGKHYTVYYTPRFKIILSAERME